MMRLVVVVIVVHIIKMQHRWQKKKIPQRPTSVVREFIPCRPLSWWGWNPIKPVYKLARWPAQLATSAFSQLSQYASSPGHRTYCYTQNSPFSSLVVAITIASTHFTYPWRDDQAELAWVAWLNTEMVYPRMVTYLSTNPAQCRVTSLMCPTTLPLSQVDSRLEWLDWVEFNAPPDTV